MSLVSDQSQYHFCLILLSIGIFHQRSEFKSYPISDTIDAIGFSTYKSAYNTYDIYKPSPPMLKRYCSSSPYWPPAELEYQPPLISSWPQSLQKVSGQ